MLLHLHRDTGRIEHRRFAEVVEILRPGDLLVMNDTRVSAIRLFGRKPTGGEVEALLLREEAPGRYEALVKPGRRLKEDARIEFPGGLAATVREARPDGRRLLEFEARPDLLDRLAEVGRVPLPPYIREKLGDDERYQTVYSRQGGSAAAPTAGLHFTPELLEALRAGGVETAWVTLDVGLDTFRPLQAENLAEHRMHGERCVMPQETATKIAKTVGRIIAVGTTTVRTLETFATGTRSVQPGETVSHLFIRPGFRFQVVDGMFTNFHMPRTSMLMMIAALSTRERIMEAYGEALNREYRFLSFGDSMLIL
jgi:S-adenosylmethionine:tRNA ribosyltransferase-isomerase